MTDSKYKPNDNPYLRVYPELNVLESPIIGILFLTFIVSIPVLAWNALYHAIHILGVTIGVDAMVFAPRVVSDELLADPIRGRLVSLGAIIISVLYMYLLIFIMKRIYPSIEQNISRLRTITVSSWSLSRFRKMAAHSFYGQIGYWIVFISVWFLWARYILPRFDGLLVTGGLFLLAFFVVVFSGELLRSTPRGQRMLDWYFRVIAGYEDGSVGRRLHIPYKTLEESFSRDEIEYMVPDELYDQVVKTDKLEDE